MSISNSINADSTNWNWLNLNAKSLTVDTLNANTIISSRVEGNLSLSNSFAYQITGATSDPATVNGAQSLFNGVLEFKSPPANACTVTMPTASILNTVIPVTHLDSCSFVLDLYNTSTTAAVTVTFTGALGIFNYKTNASNSPIVLVIPFANGASHVSLKFVRTQPGGFWTVYY